MTRANYGIDAPGMVRVLLIGGAVLTLVCGIALALPSSPDVNGVAHGFIWTGLWMMLAGGWMILCSRVLKFAVCRHMIAKHDWRGDERVLDIGCGRGLSLIAAAKRLDEGGHATGIDLWAAKDLSGNAPEHTLANARIEGVADRIAIDTGDACALPYPDASFDVVTSMTAIHNIPSAAGRAQALAEMARVLAPGGQLLLFDIFHPFAYPRELRRAGMTVRRVGIWPLWMLPGVTLSAHRP